MSMELGLPAMAGVSALWHGARKGASRGEGERVRERGKLECPLLEGIEAR